MTTSNEADSTTQTLLSKAIQNFEAGALDDAFNTLIEVKRRRTPLQYVDYLRAVYFIRKNKLGDAREALKEELRYFPDNRAASLLLQELQKGNAIGEPRSELDPEFAKVLSTVGPYTMVPVNRLFSLYTLAKELCLRDLPGDFVECGVAAGGSSALLAYTIKTYSKRERCLYACDSFEGMPSPTERDTHQGVMAEATGWGSGTCSATVDSLFEVCGKLGVSHLVKPIKGYFEETLSPLRNQIKAIAFLHMDGDWYESTRTILSNLYDLTLSGGFIQVDDYDYWDGCRKALHEFKSERNLEIRFNTIQDGGVWFQKN